MDGSAAPQQERGRQWMRENLFSYFPAAKLSWSSVKSGINKCQEEKKQYPVMNSLDKVEYS